MAALYQLADGLHQGAVFVFFARLLAGALAGLVIGFSIPKDTKVVSWRIVNNSYNRKYPSDHFPVVIEWSLAE